MTLLQTYPTANVFSCDGVQTVWNFSFTGGYIDLAHVKAVYTEVSGAVAPVPLNIGMFIGPYQLSITPALGAGGTLTLYRSTPKELPLVDFADGARISEASLDIMAKQSVFVASETLDGFPDIRLVNNRANKLWGFDVDGNFAVVAPDEQSASALALSLSGSNGSSQVGFIAAGTGAVPRTMQAKGRESVSVLDSGAVGDGTTDDTAAFTLALNSGAARVLVPGGRTYIVKDATNIVAADVLVLPAGVQLEGDGPGAVIKLGAHSTIGHRLIKVAGANSSVLNLTLDGNKAQQTGVADEQSHLLFILGGSNIRAHDVMFKDAMGDGVYIGGTTEPGPVNVEISGCRFDGNVRQGISLVRGSQIRIIGNDIANTTGSAPGAGIDLEANLAADTLKQIVIANNTIRDNYWGIFVHELAPAREVTITGNTFSGNRAADVFCRGTQITIADNIIAVGAKVVTYAAIDMTDCAQVSVTGNTIIGNYDPEERGGIRVSRGVRSSAIVGNTIKNTLGSGISVYPGNALGTGESRGITVIGNVLENCLPDGSTSGAMVIGAAAAAVADLFDVVVRGNIIRDTRTGGLQAALGIRIINETAAMLQTWDIGANAISGPTAQITAISSWAAVNTMLTAKATLNFDLTATASQDLTISVPGAVSGAPVLLGVPNGSLTADTLFWAWVSATDTVTVRAMRIAGTPNPASGTFTVTVAKLLA